MQFLPFTGIAGRRVAWKSRKNGQALFLLIKLRFVGISGDVVWHSREQLVVLCSIDAGAELHLGEDKQLLYHKLLKLHE